jgi:pimeloyl-ACP methyl ester carboxylesterase
VTAPLPTRIALFAGLRSRPSRLSPDEAARELRAFGQSPGFQQTLQWTVGARVAVGMQNIDVPVRIVFGTADLMLGAFTAPRYATAIPGADLIALPGLGHVPMNDDATTVAATIVQFTTADP